MTKERTLSDITIDYFEEYKQKALKLKNLKSKLSVLKIQAQKEIDLLNEQIISLEQESLTMRRIITQVLENETDPVSVKLIDDHYNKTNIWQPTHVVGGQPELTTYDLNQAAQSYGVGSSIITSLNSYGGAIYPNTNPNPNYLGVGGYSISQIPVTNKTIP